MIQRWIRQQQLGAFVAITFGWTWGWDALFFVFDLWDVLAFNVPRVWGPLVAALVVIGASERSLRTWFARRLQWRLRPALFLVALLVPLAISNLQPVIAALGGGSLVYAPPAAVHLMAVWILLNVFLLGGTEEIGWRGVLQPRLQARVSVLTAGLGIGVLWWLWHLPLFLTGNPNYSLEPWAFAAYTAFALGASTVFAALANVTDGSVLPVMVMHGAVNLGAALEASGGVLTGSPVIPLIGAGLWWLIVLALVLRYGRSMVPNPTLKPIA